MSISFRIAFARLGLALVFLGGFIEAAEPGASSHKFYVDVDSLGGACADENPGTADRPWKTALKAFSTAEPGDTVVFRRGIYRLKRTIKTSDFKLDPERSGAVRFMALKGEEVVITNLHAVDAGDWKQIATTPSGKPIFAAPSGDEGRVTNLTQNGIPLIRAPTDDPRYPHSDSPPGAITNSGEWASSLRDHRVMVCPADGKMPGGSIELCDVRDSNGHGNLIALERDAEDRCRNLYLIFDNITFETGFYGLLIRTGFVELRQCVLRKSFGDLINTLTGRIVVDGCDFYAFGESAIDVTEAGTGPMPRDTPPMVIRNSRFHDNVEVRSPTPKVKGYNAVMLKGGTKDVVVEGCQFYRMRTTLGVLNLGGATSGGLPREGIRLNARNNIFREISGSSIVWFAGSEDCRLLNNLISNCNVDDIIGIDRAKASDPATGNRLPQVQNNIFYRNKVRRSIVSVSRGAAPDLLMDHNLIVESGESFVLDGVAVLLKDIPLHGIEIHGVREAPRFRDFANNDFHPAQGSSVANRGADLRALVKDDADGVRRSQDKAPSLGPFEMH